MQIICFMKKFFYIMPAVLICMLYGLLIALAGSLNGIQAIAFVYILCPIGAGILMRKGKWWGCLFGIAMGILLLYNGFSAQIMVTMIAGSVLALYYLGAGIVCAVSCKK